MEYTSVTNPIWVDSEYSAINCIVNFTNLGQTPVPFSANPLDTSNPSSITIYDQCIAGNYGPIAVYVLPIPLTVEQKRISLLPLSAWQVRKVLTQLGLRDSIETAIANANQATKDAWTYASSFQRDDAMLNSMAVSLGITDVQLDGMFELGVTL